MEMSFAMIRARIGDTESDERRRNSRLPVELDARVAVVALSVAALAVFVACLVVGGYVILFHLGRDRWFFSDEWSMIAGRDVAGFGDLLRPNNAHWSGYSLKRATAHASWLRVVSVPAMSTASVIITSSAVLRAAFFST